MQLPGKQIIDNRVKKNYKNASSFQQHLYYKNPPERNNNKARNNIFIYKDTADVFIKLCTFDCISKVLKRDLGKLNMCI